MILIDRSAVSQPEILYLHRSLGIDNVADQVSTKYSVSTGDQTMNLQSSNIIGT